MAICLGLGLTSLVFVMLPEHRDRLAPEQGPLLKGLCWSLLLAGLAAASFVGELRLTARRKLWQAGLLLVTALVVTVYWPR